jgi:hypothetical protein
MDDTKRDLNVKMTFIAIGNSLRMTMADAIMCGRTLAVVVNGSPCRAADGLGLAANLLSMDVRNLLTGSR